MKFNAVVEGTYHDQWKTLNYRVLKIEIPEEITTLNDGTFKYKLFGKTDNFESIQKVEIEGPEKEIDFVGFLCSWFLERPRTICTLDGRIFVEEEMLKDDQSVNALPEIVKTSKKIFYEYCLLTEK